MYVFIFLVKVTEWPPIGKIAAYSAYDMFHGIKYLIVSLVFSHLGFWSGNLFLIAPFPDLCPLVPFNKLIIHVCIVMLGVNVAYYLEISLSFSLCFLTSRMFIERSL